MKITVNLDEGVLKEIAWCVTDAHRRRAYAKDLCLCDMCLTLSQISYKNDEEEIRKVCQQLGILPHPYEHYTFQEGMIQRGDMVPVMVEKSKLAKFT